MVKKTRKPCPNCNGQGRIRTFIMHSYDTPSREVWFDFLTCVRCRGSGKIWIKEYAHDKKLS